MYLTDRDLANRYQLGREVIWRWLRDNPKFPRPLKLSGKCTRWRLEDIEAFEATLIQKYKKTPARNEPGG